MKQNQQGFLLVFIAFLTWGLLPAYWHLLATVDPLEVLCHRIIWSVFTLGACLLYRRSFLATIYKLKDPKIVKTIGISSALICINWLLYVWAIGNGYFIEAGLGYYICPLFTLALGWIFLKEYLDTEKRIAIFIVTLGVMLKIISTGYMPIVALGLAASFAFYSLVRKIAVLGALEGLFLETLFAAIPACAYLLYLMSTHQSSFINDPMSIKLLLFSSGAITAIPLLMLASGAPYVSLQTIAVVQFLTPTLNLLVGYFNGHEILAVEFPGYIILWLGIGVYIWPGIKTFFQDRFSSPSKA